MCKECEKSENRFYHRSDKKRTAARRAKYVSENREQVNETSRAWVARNRDRINERRKMYATNINRAAREFGLPAEFTVEDKEDLIERFGGCALTGEKENIHFDHVIPISLGIGGTVRWNILPIRAGLNISKGRKNVFEWFEQNKERFSLDEDRFWDAIKYLAEQKGVTVDEYKEFVYECFSEENQEKGRFNE